MQSVCPICEIKVNEVEGEYICKKCGAKWKVDVWRAKQSLFKQKPSWLSRNAERVKTLFASLCVIIPLSAAVLLVAQTVMIGG